MGWLHTPTPSKSKVYCWRRAITGPDNKYFTFTLCFFLCLSLIFYIYITPFIVRRALNISIPLIVIFAITNIFCLVNLIITAYKDPGIIPRQPPVEEDPFRHFKRTMDVKVNGVKLQRKYCETCNLFRPLRVSHCSVCDNCVEDFDHHCPWVGNCIGRRNYRFFLSFIYSLLFNIVLMYLACILHIITIWIASGDFVRGIWWVLLFCSLSIFIMLLLIPVTFLVGVLVLFHTTLLFKNMTTYEHIRGQFRRNNPFYIGVCQNIIVRCCNLYYSNNIQYIMEYSEDNERDVYPPVKDWPPKVQRYSEIVI